MSLAYGKDIHEVEIHGYVARITFCKAVPFYGFHVGWKTFLKIYMLNPSYMQRLTDLLRNGSIMGKSFQPYEAHIPYLLQFMADFGLYGCGWVNCETVTFRAPVPLQGWHESGIPKHLITSDKSKPRLSHCSVEVDLLAQHIQNRETIKPRLIHHDFIERTKPDSPDKKLVHSMAELWKDVEKRYSEMGNPPPDSASDSPDQPGEPEDSWIHEADLRRKLDRLIREERSRGAGQIPCFETFVNRETPHSLIQTALESVMDMFTPDVQTRSSRRENYIWLVSSSGVVQQNVDYVPSVEVDEDRILDLLKDMKQNPADAFHYPKGDDSFSDRTSESLSDVDFDSDLLGRGLDEVTAPSTAFPVFSSDHGCLNTCLY
jgi:DNA polymerase zeta